MAPVLERETGVQAVPDAEVRLQRRQPRIGWRDGGGVHAVIVKGRMVIGSAPGADLRIDDPLVSRVHAELDVRLDGTWVRDLGSRNGTFVNGLRIASACLPARGRLRVGAVELSVDREAGESQAVELWGDRGYDRMVGSSALMRELFATLDRVAPTAAPVLVHGETGTGKELVAQAIHHHSPRASKPFVVIDCGALPGDILDAELFGHAKGAFTGAAGARPGAFEAADGGTVFLDEIGELPLPMQPKLLRVLEAGTVRRLGETSYRRVDVRIVAATHRDLLTMVGRGEFREDLYFRLSVVPLRVPALRERREDVQPLLRHFLRDAEEVDPAIVEELSSRPWRGNVRELRNVAERIRTLGLPGALALIRGEPVTASVNPAQGMGPMKPPPEPRLSSLPDAAFEVEFREFREALLEQGEREYVRRLLVRFDRNVTEAARAAGVDRSYLHRLIKRHGL